MPRFKNRPPTEMLKDLLAEALDELPIATPPGLALRKVGQVPERLSALCVDGDTVAALNHPQTILLATHQKAGTHHARYLIANYLELLIRPDAAPVDHERLQAIMPNMRCRILAGRRPRRRPELDYSRFGIREILYSHVSDQSLSSTIHHHQGKQILLYRNPLDFLISIWHYNYLQRPKRHLRHTPLRSVLGKEIRKYAWQVAYLKRLAAANPDRTVVITYERLKRDTAAVFRSVLEAVGLPLNDDVLTRAIQRSSFDAIRAQEDRRGKSIVARIEGRFTRSGAVGQWRDHLQSTDVEQVRGVLAKFDLSLDDFELE